MRLPARRCAPARIQDGENLILSPRGKEKIMFARVVLAIFATASISAAMPASAQSVSFTSLKEPACKGAPGNAQARKDEHGHVIYSCSGAAGWRVRLVYRGTSVIAEFTPTTTKQKSFTLGAPYDIGPRIEWRSATKGGAPYAAIVRLHSRADAGRVESALAVLGVSGSKMCLSAVVSPAAPPNQNAAAITAADELKTSGLCAGMVRTIGPEAETTRELVQRNRYPD
jgi:hypothetical protein